jgi:hypothetical protein
MIHERLVRRAALQHLSWPLKVSSGSAVTVMAGRLAGHFPHRRKSASRPERKCQNLAERAPCAGFLHARKFARRDAAEKPATHEPCGKMKA